MKPLLHSNRHLGALGVNVKLAIRENVRQSSAFEGIRIAEVTHITRPPVARKVSAKKAVKSA